MFGKYDYVGKFNLGIALASLDEKWGYINKNGEEVIELKYDSPKCKPIIRKVLSGLPYMGHRKWMVIDIEGNVYRYDFVEPFLKRPLGSKLEYKDYIVVGVDGEHGVINAQGELVIPCMYEQINLFRNNSMTSASKGNKWGVIDKNNIEILPFEHDYALVSAYEDLIAIKLGNIYKVITKENKEVFSIECEGLNFYSKNLIVVKINGKYGIIDTEGNQIVPFKYDYIYNNDINELLVVELDKKRGIINKQGDEISPCKYDDIELYSSNNLIKYILNGKFGLMDKNGIEKTEAIYDYIEDSKDGLYQFSIEKKLGFIDEEGSEYIFKNARMIGPDDEILFNVKYKDTIIFKGDRFFGNKDALLSKVNKAHKLDIYAKEYIEYIDELSAMYF